MQSLVRRQIPTNCTQHRGDAVTRHDREYDLAGLYAHNVLLCHGPGDVRVPGGRGRGLCCSNVVGGYGLWGVRLARRVIKGRDLANQAVKSSARHTADAIGEPVTSAIAEQSTAEAR